MSQHSRVEREAGEGRSQRSSHLFIVLADGRKDPDDACSRNVMNLVQGSLLQDQRLCSGSIQKRDLAKGNETLPALMSSTGPDLLMQSVRRGLVVVARPTTDTAGLMRIEVMLTLIVLEYSLGFERN